MSPERRKISSHWMAPCPCCAIFGAVKSGVLPILAAAALIGCGSSKSGFAPADGAKGTVGADGGSDEFGDGGPSGVFEGGSAPGSDCAEETKQIFVVSKEHGLYRFDPTAKKITKIGTIQCPSHGADPFSMAVDRKGFAWILYDDGNVYRVNTKDASCAATAFKRDQNGFHVFGMAFMTDAPGSSSETLFVADNGQQGIAKIDTSTLALRFVGSYDGFSAPGELTGTGSARLFAFFTAQAPITWPRIAELDPLKGRILDQKGLMGTEIGSGFAFAHWGGDFWLFTAPNDSSEITRYSWAQESTDSIMQDLGYTIVGAGVSTCAPTAPPK
jgi:hypothetical protein